MPIPRCPLAHAGVFLIFSLFFSCTQAARWNSSSEKKVRERKLHWKINNRKNQPTWENFLNSRPQASFSLPPAFSRAPAYARRAPAGFYLHSRRLLFLFHRASAGFFFSSTGLPLTHAGLPQGSLFLPAAPP